jgi:hypothetical protein
VHRKEGAVAGTPTDDLLVIGVFLDVQTAYKGDNVLVAPLFDTIIKANSAEMKSLKSGKKEEAAAPAAAAGDISTVLTSPYELLPPAPEHFRSVLSLCSSNDSYYNAAAVIVVCFGASYALYLFSVKPFSTARQSMYQCAHWCAVLLA